MKKTFLVSICLLAAGVTLVGAAKPASIEQQLTQANSTLQLATMRHDAATVRNLITEDYVIYFGNGSSEDHDGLLKDVGDPSVVWQKNDTENIAVRSYNGDTGVVTAALHQRYVYQK